MVRTEKTDRTGNRGRRLGIPERKALQRADQSPTIALSGDIPQGLRAIEERARQIRHENALDNPDLGLTLPVYDGERDLSVGEPILRSGLEVSLFELGSTSFRNMLITAYGLSTPDFPPTEGLADAIKLRGDASLFRGAEQGSVDEVVLLRLTERERVNKLYPTSQLDSNFFAFLRKTYGITSDTELQKFYHDNMDYASNFFRWYISKVHPQSKNHLSQRNEVDPPPADPSRLFQLLVSRNSSDALKIEVQRIFAAFFISCEFTSRQWETRLRGKLNNIIAALDERMFAGQTGEAHNVSILAWHNSKTGRVINMQDPTKPLIEIPEDARLKEHKLRMRQILGTGERVWIDLDEKGIYSSMAKSVHKAANAQAEPTNGRTGRKGSILPVRDAVDLCRLVIVANGDVSMRDDVLKKLVEVVSASESYEFLDDVEWIKRDDKTHKKSKSRSYKHRRVQIKFADLPIPVEIEVFDVQNYLNSQLAVGKKVRGHYDGEAHELFEFIKLAELNSLFFPESEWGNLQPEIDRQEDAIAIDILERTLEARAA